MVAVGVNQSLGTLINRTDQPQWVAIHYYEAMRSQNYTTAYADFDTHAALNGQPLDEQSFVKLAVQADNQQGEVSTYDVLEVGGNTGGFNVGLRRGSQTYTVHLQLQQIDRVWKITTIDGL